MAGGEGNDPSGDAMARPPSILKIEGPTWTHALPLRCYTCPGFHRCEPVTVALGGPLLDP